MTDQRERTATCACGALSIRVRGAPVKAGVCHCEQCQRRTGSAFGIGAFFDMGQVIATAGDARSWTRRGDSGRAVTFHFCPTCGSNLYWTRDHRPDLMTIAGGAFADPDFPTPTGAYWVECRPGWLSASDLPQHTGNG